jgi:hypothetical protein
MCTPVVFAALTLRLVRAGQVGIATATSLKIG